MAKQSDDLPVRHHRAKSTMNNFCPRLFHQDNCTLHVSIQCTYLCSINQDGPIFNHTLMIMNQVDDLKSRLKGELGS